MKYFCLILAVVALSASAASAQNTSTKIDQQLSADWQALNTALQHVQQDIVEKMTTAAADQKRIIDMEKQISDLKKLSAPTPAKP